MARFWVPQGFGGQYGEFWVLLGHAGFRCLLQSGMTRAWVQQFCGVGILLVWIQSVLVTPCLWLGFRGGLKPTTLWAWTQRGFEASPPLSEAWTQRGSVAWTQRGFEASPPLSVACTQRGSVAWTHCSSSVHSGVYSVSSGGSMPRKHVWRANAGSHSSVLGPARFSVCQGCRISRVLAPGIISSQCAGFW